MAASLFRSRTRSQPRLPPRGRQRGVIMIITLVSLVLLMIGVAAMLRAGDTSALVVGNLAFRRDLTNRAETAIAQAKLEFVSGGLSSEAARSVTPTAPNTLNYSATTLASNSDGIPIALVNDATYTANGYVPTTFAAEPSLTVRWLIDRQCLAGTTAFNSATCESLPSSGDVGGTSWLRKPGGMTNPVYRISVRVSGPRHTDAYFQTTYVD